MAVFPNNDCANFCYWMLNVSWQQLTTPRLTLITDVYNAAITGTSVSDNDWANFTQITAWRNKYYLIYRDYQYPFASATMAYLANLPVQPTPLIASYYNEFIQGCIDDGNWSTFDVVLLLAAYDSSNVVINMKNPSSNKAAFIGSPTFLQNTYVKGNGTTTGINTNFNPSSFGGNLTLNSSHIGIYNRTSRAAAAKCDCGVITTGPNRLLRIYPRYTGDVAIYSNNSSSESSSANTNSDGWIQSIRSASNLTTLYRNGSSIGTSTNVSAALPNGNMALCGQYVNGAFGTESSDDELSLFIAGGVPNDNNALNTRVNTLATQLGF